MLTTLRLKKNVDYYTSAPENPLENGFFQLTVKGF